MHDHILHRARLVVGWVTVSGFISRCGTFISVCDQPSRSAQPGHLFVGSRSEYQPKQVKLCDAIVIHGPYVSTLEIQGL